MKVVTSDYPTGTKECPACGGYGNKASEAARALIRQIPLGQRRAAIQAANFHYGTCETCNGKGWVKEEKVSSSQED